MHRSRYDHQLHRQLPGLQLGQCLPNIPLIANCKIGLNTGMCKLCNPDFYLNSAFQC